MSETKKTRGERWLDIGVCGWLVRWELVNDSWLDFKAYEAIGENENNGEPDDGAKLYMGKGRRSEDNHVTDPDAAEPTISGFVKWDGCAEYAMGQPHFCGRSDVEAFAKVMIAIHELAGDAIPGFDRELGAR